MFAAAAVWGQKQPLYEKQRQKWTPETWNDEDEDFFFWIAALFCPSSWIDTQTTESVLEVGGFTGVRQEVNYRRKIKLWLLENTKLLSGNIRILFLNGWDWWVSLRSVRLLTCCLLSSFYTECPCCVTGQCAVDVFRPWAQRKARMTLSVPLRIQVSEWETCCKLPPPLLNSHGCLRLSCLVWLFCIYVVISFFLVLLPICVVVAHLFVVLSLILLLLCVVLWPWLWHLCLQVVLLCSIFSSFWKSFYITL